MMLASLVCSSACSATPKLGMLCPKSVNDLPRIPANNPPPTPPPAAAAARLVGDQLTSVDD